MMRFTRRANGGDYVTLRVDFHLTREDVAFAVAVDLVGEFAHDVDGGLAEARGIGRAKVAEIVRDTLSVFGPPSMWNEYGEDAREFHALYEVLWDRVHELWPGEPEEGR